ncbi:prolyl oligopeptidase family serine peptidase [Sphingobium sp. H39-3-25]|uniref:prolyl oligopeptidase family serine peptidase n=1 Tax=Sphingobium arseniciresistens TaxID=3030834 RepID=UPI0023B98170|nr:prolyl oligopeptidase family serine peptidase [Sphingobium arseniciresistens]
MVRLCRQRLRVGFPFAIILCLLFVATPGWGEELAPSLTDIIETRSIDSLLISPDGRRVAFRVISPSVSRDQTTERWYSVELSGISAPEPLGHKADPIWMSLYDIPQDGVVQWGPSSRVLYVLQERRSAIDIHRIGIDGDDTEITHDDADVVSFKLSPDFLRISYHVRNSRAEIARAQAEQERTGIHLDPTTLVEGLRLTRNFRIGSRDTTIKWLDGNVGIEAFAGSLREKGLNIGAPRKTISADQTVRTITPVSDGEGAPGLTIVGSGTTFQIKKIKDADALYGYPTYQVFVSDAEGSIQPCPADFCAGLPGALREVAVNDETGELIVLYEKDYSGQTAVYGWNPVTGKRREILAPTSALDGGSSYSGAMCPQTGRYLICVRSSATRPPHLVRIDLTSGEVRSIADPNAVLAEKKYPKVRFEEWQDSRGQPGNGILLLPDKVTSNLPLVITTYRCRGFLRGGTANVTPEFLMAQRGFAVLCVNNNNSARWNDTLGGGDTPLSQHKATIESYRAIVNHLSASGLIDRSRVGISGHSYSSNVIAYALSHSDLFATAVIGTGITIDPVSIILSAPTAESPRKGVAPMIGLPQPEEDPDGIWPRISPSANSARIKAPLLIQSPEAEYLYAIQLYRAIQRSGGLVDMYIYPGAGHMVGRHPVHQFYRALRSIDWFTSHLKQRQ